MTMPFDFCCWSHCCWSRVLEHINEVTLELNPVETEMGDRLRTYPLGWRRGVVDSVVRRMKEVTLRRARLKGKKERKSIYIAPFCTKVHTKRSGMDLSFTCKQHHACLSFVAFTRCHHHSNWGSRHPIAAQYSFIDPERMKGWVGLVGWPIADGLPT